MAGYWMDDVFGPDGMRVTFRIEEAADRLIRASDELGLFNDTHLLRMLSKTVDDGVHRAVEEVVNQGRWNLYVEADSGGKRRVSLASYDLAVALGERISDAVRTRGVAGMDDLPD